MAYNLTIITLFFSGVSGRVTLLLQALRGQAIFFACERAHEIVSPYDMTVMSPLEWFGVVCFKLFKCELGIASRKVVSNMGPGAQWWDQEKNLPVGPGKIYWQVAI